MTRKPTYLLLMLFLFLALGCSKSKNQSLYESSMNSIQTLLSGTFPYVSDNVRIETSQALKFDEFGAVTISIREKSIYNSGKIEDGERAITFNIRTLSLPVMRFNALPLANKEPADVWLSCQDDKPCIFHSPSGKISGDWVIHINGAANRDRFFELLDQAKSNVRE